MATWKKISVSGSNISQFNNDAGYLTTATDLNAFATASINGVDLLAGQQGQISFVTASGEGITAVGTPGTDTVTLGLSSIPNSSLANSTIYISGSGISNEGSVALGATASIDVQVDDSTIGFTGNSLQVKDGSIGTTQIADSLGNINENSFTGSFSGSFTGNVTIDLADLTEGTGITAFTYDGNSAQTVSIKNADNLTNNVISKWDDGNGQFTDSSLTDNGSTITGTTSIQLTGANSNLSGSFSGSFEGDGSGLTGAGGASIISGDAADNQVAVFNSTNTIAGYSQFTFDDSTNKLTVTGDQLITGNLRVQGTASFESRNDLQIADRFILMASGSTSPGDGGIVVQQTTQDVGELFGFDNDTSRWAIDSNFNATDAAFIPEAFMAAAINTAGNDPNGANDPGATYNKKGNLYVASNSEDIWIYS